MAEEYGVAGPRGQEVARAMLDAAARAGYPSSAVRTTIRGYIAPVAVIKEYEKTFTKKGVSPVTEPIPVQDSEPEVAVPDKTWKVDELRKYAEDHGIELNGYVKKADLLAAITADTKEE